MRQYEMLNVEILPSGMSTIPLHNGIPFENIGKFYPEGMNAAGVRLKVGTKQFSWES
jgi:hypothetical protein